MELSGTKTAIPTFSDEKSHKKMRLDLNKKTDAVEYEIGSLRSRKAKTTKEDILFKMKQQCKSTLKSR